MLCDGGKVIRRRISLVAIVAVARVGRVMGQHFAIARHFCKDLRRRDAGASTIAVDHAALRHQQLRNTKRVD